MIPLSDTEKNVIVGLTFLGCVIISFAMIEWWGWSLGGPVSGIMWIGWSMLLHRIGAE